MTREEYRRWLAYEVRRGNIDAAQARELLRQFDAGELAARALMLDAGSALDLRRPPADEQENGWLLLLAALGLLALARRRRRQGGPGGWLAMLDRTRMRDDLRTEWGRTTTTLAQYLAATGDVAGWQRQMGTAIRTYYARQYMAGAGRALTAGEWADLDTRLRTQMSYLARFAADAHVRLASGQPYSAGYLAGRSALYGGGAWGLWHEAVDDEYADQPGWVVDYLAVDDDHTCDDCSTAAALGPYLPGAAPLPGTICQGGSSCRCWLRYRRAPETYRELGGV